MYVTANLALRDMLKISKTTKETRYVLRGKVLIDGVTREDHRFPVGFMDVISVPPMKKNYRVTITKKGKISMIETSEQESKLKLCRINKKTAYKGKIQATLHDGRTLIVDKKDPYKVGDTMLVELPKASVKEHIPLAKGALIMLLGGSHMGSRGKIIDIEGQKISFLSEDGSTYETLKRYAFAIGRDEAAIKLQ